VQRSAPWSQSRTLQLQSGTPFSERKVRYTTVCKYHPTATYTAPAVFWYGICSGMYVLIHERNYYVKHAVFRNRIRSGKCFLLLHGRIFAGFRCGIFTGMCFLLHEKEYFKKMRRSVAESIPEGAFGFVSKRNVLSAP